MTRPTSATLSIAVAAGILLAAAGAASAQAPATAPAAAPAARLAVLWKAELGKSIVAAPAVEGQSVFVGDQAGRLTSLDLATGKQQWQTDLGSAISASPLVHDGLVYVGDEEGKFHAVEAKTGKDQVLLTAGDKIVGQAALRGAVIYVGSYDRCLYAIDITTRQKLWSFETEAQLNAGPVIAGDAVVIAGCDAKLRALDAKAGQERWSVDVGGPVAATPLVLGDRVFAATLKGDRVAVNASTGKLLWQNREESDADGGTSFMTSPVFSPKTPDWVDFTSQSGHVLSHDLQSGKWCATSFVSGRVSATPALWEGDFYYATEEGKLYGPLRGKADAGLWFTAGAGIKASPVAAGNRLVLADEDGTVWCLAKSGDNASNNAK